MSDSKKLLSSSFLDEYKDVNEDTAMQLIVEAENTIKRLEEERASDEKLATAKQMVKDLNSGYSNAIKHERAKIKFLLEKINEIRNSST